MPTKLEHALAHAAHGFKVFPLIPGGKTPLLEGWPQKATTDEKQITEWWSTVPNANIGIATSGLIVVDVDPRNGGTLTFDELKKSNPFPDTIAAKTQGGGIHLYYKLPDDVDPANYRGGRNKLGAGVDIKSHGGYVVAPGSTVDNRAYEWIPKHSPDDLLLAAVMS